MKRSQTLVSLLIVVAVSVIVISSILGLMINNAYSTSSVEQGTLVKLAAESGMETALLRLLRDPSYSGETLSNSINGYTTVITVTGDNINKTLQSVASSSNYVRKIVVTVAYNNNIMQVNSWQDSQ
ncbi:hypothetical protein M1328_03860 [Patescibacteria group bacterium]|nr:hypothetical protein [Patescibacteria group bacterium]